MFSMREIRIWVESSWSHEKKLDLIKRLVGLALRKDKSWHFFYEYSLIVIRFDSNFEDLIERHMKLVAEEFTEDTYINYSFGDYEENIDATKKYLGHFITIFHGFSTLAINIDHEKDYSAVTDRVLHCWLNMATCDNNLNKFLASIPEGNLHQNSESIIGHLVSNMRSFTSGFFTGNSTPRMENKYSDKD